eukprot:6178812-Pleurochrysis_carterae.AAC.2
MVKRPRSQKLRKRSIVDERRILHYKYYAGRTRTVEPHCSDAEVRHLSAAQREAASAPYARTHARTHAHTAVRSRSGPRGGGYHIDDTVFLTRRETPSQ